MSHSQGEDLSVRPQRQGKGKRDLHKNGLRSLFGVLQFSLRVKKPEASENVPWNAERESASQGDCPDCQQEAAEISNQSSNHSSRQQSHAYDSHVKLWHEQNSGNKLPPLNVIQTGEKKNARNPNSAPCGQRCTEWTEERRKHARYKAYKLHRELFNIIGHSLK